MNKVVSFGEVMMRLTVPNYGRFTQAASFESVFGGSEANVTASLTQMGVRGAHVTVFPDNDLGKLATSTLHSYGVEVDHILYREGRLGLYFLENGAMYRSPKIIYDRFESTFARLNPDELDWDTILEGATWFHWTGITPAISQQAADACLQAITIAKRKGLTVSGDINYRRNLWQYGKSVLEIMPELISHCDMIVAGITDIHNCLNIDAEGYSEACLKVNAAFPNIKKIAKTIRTTHSASHNSLKGVIWTPDGKVKSKTHELTHIVDRVGTGDAFMAGLIYGWINQLDDQFTVDFAAAASAFKHTVVGDVNLTSADEIMQIMKGENLGKLLR